MSSNPYENEPGFETANDEVDKKNQKDYVAKVRLEMQCGCPVLTVCRSAMNPSEYPSYKDWKSISASHPQALFNHML